MSQACAINNDTARALDRFKVAPPAGGWKNLDRSYLQKTIGYIESLNNKRPPRIPSVSSRQGWIAAKAEVESDRGAIVDYAYYSSYDRSVEKKVGVTEYTTLMRTLRDPDLPIRLKQIKAENKRYRALATQYPNIGEDIRGVVSRIEEDFSKIAGGARVGITYFSYKDNENIRWRPHEYNIQNYKINLLKTHERLSIPPEDQPFYSQADALKKIRAVKQPVNYLLPVVDDLFKDPTYNRHDFIRIGVL